MADKPIDQLNEAEKIYATDLFVLQQSGSAKKLTGQVLLNWLTAAADGHGGIQSIQKLSASGLKDTYRITMADTTIFDFVVTNGRSITSITQTSVSGLTRTYTIAFNDASAQTFTVTDGRAITDISKTATSGLADTYTIRYNNGTTSTFTVTNGAKGDKGDNAYVWIKYASQEPTESSHSMGDIPDNWIGIYSGNASSAPSDWKQYKWFKHKGEKGDTGDAATLVTKSVTYQVGDSGSIVPSGSWNSSIPVVPQGKYLWTKTEIRFNSGEPIVSYVSARQGLDGSGSVASVNDVSPDETGNVTLTAADVGALPTAGGDVTGEIRMNGQPISGLNAPTEDTQAATKGYVDSNKVDKVNVVNNFTTTEEGFVADARALKVLNDKITQLIFVPINDILLNIDGVSMVQNSYYCKIGKLCIVCIELKTSKVMEWDADGSASTPENTVPKAISYNTNGVLVSEVSGSVGKFFIDKKGKINLRMPMSNGYYMSGQCVYATND